MRQGNQIWDALIAKMKEVGYDRFDLGLPGNLIPVRREDYVDHDMRFGGGTRADGSDGFQMYENGGATACYAYFTIQALRELGRYREAESILFPMLKSFEEGGFQGRGPSGMTYDWVSWNGTPHGYEGLLVDNYLALLAALPRDAGFALRAQREAGNEAQTILRQRPHGIASSFSVDNF